MLAALLNLGFAGGQAAAPQPEVTTSTGGGKSRRYPRRVMVRGRLYVVRSALEERQLLQAVLDRAREAAPASPAEVRQQVRIQRRLKQAEDEEAQWMARLREIDDELLLLVD